MIAFLNLSLQILALAAGLAGQPEALNSDRQLFLDDHLLDLAQTHDVARTLNPPQDVQRILKPDQPWERLGFIFYCCVVDDNGTAKLYHGSYDAEKKKHFMLATSTDGLHWERPKLGLKAFEGSKENNLLPMEVVEAGIFLDAHSSPAERYRMVYTKGWPDPARGGVYAASSADGIHWNPGETRMLPFVPDSQPSAVWDEERGEYAIYLRDWAAALGPKPIRTIARVAAKDWHTPWTYDSSAPPYLVWGKDKIATPSKELQVVMAPDAQDPDNLQLYTSAVVKYPYAPHVYLAFPAAYLLFKSDDFKGRAVTTNDGNFDAQFAASRDGIAWKRWREPYMGAGLQGNLDLRLVSMGPGMVRRGPWLYQYFVGWPHTHGQPGIWDQKPETRAEWMSRDLGGLYCTRQRVDGFVSMNAGNTPAVLATQPFTFKGGRLHLNVHTDGVGSVKAALLDAEGKELPGFETSACEAINADAIDYEVRWTGGTDVSSLQGRPVRLRLTLRHARLYAFQFTEL